jgi:myo-inositol-1(or 4)-monophosphatase
MKNVSLKSALATAVQAAHAAGQVMQANWLKPKRVNCDEAHDIKLELDVRCQALIEKILTAAFPQIPILGEEGITGDVTAEYRWVVDPIDGTVNYFFGMPHAAVSIALQRWGETPSNPKLKTGKREKSGLDGVSPHREFKSVVGVIYTPFTDELWTTVRGEPARLNGKIIHVSRHTRVEDSIIALGFSKDKANLEQCLPFLNRITRRAKKIRIMGSAALELAYVASGRLDAYVERRINLWDVAAGSLLVENAGGEFYTRPAPGQYRYAMCADNGKLRKKLQVGGLLK